MQKERKTLVMGVGSSHEGFVFVFSVSLSEANYLRKRSGNSSARPGRLQGRMIL